MSKISKFWVVTNPSKNSGIIDILYLLDMKRMELQFKVGLLGKKIIGIFTIKNEAEIVAKMALLKVNAITKF